MRGAALRGVSPASSVLTPISLPLTVLTRSTRPLIPVTDTSQPNAFDAQSAKLCTRAIVKVAPNDYRAWVEANDGVLNRVQYMRAAAITGPWTKQGIVMVPAPGTWENDGTGNALSGEISPNHVIYDPGGPASKTFTLYYHGFAGAQARKIGRAFSADGVNWVRDGGNPIFSPSAGGWDAYSVHEPNVFVMPDGTYRMYYGAQTSSGNSTCGLGFATSPDGVTWTRYSGNPVISGSSGNFPFAVRRRHGYWLAWECSASLAVISWFSFDGVSWIAYGVNYLAGTAGAVDPDNIIGGICDEHDEGGTLYVTYTGLNITGNYPNTQQRYDGACLATTPDPMASPAASPYVPAQKLVQVSPYAVNTGATVTATLPAPATAGGTLIAYHLQASGTAASIPTGWSSATQQLITGSNPGTIVRIFYKVAAGGETGVTVTNGASVYSECMCIEVSGFTGVSDGTSTGPGGQSPNPQSINTLTPSTVSLPHIFVGIVGTDTPSGGFSQWQDANGQAHQPQTVRLWSTGPNGRSAAMAMIKSSPVNPNMPFSCQTRIGNGASASLHHGSVGTVFK